MTNQISGNTNLSWYEKEAVGSRWDGNENWTTLFNSSNTGGQYFSLDTIADWSLSGIDSDLFYLSDSSGWYFIDSLQEEHRTNTKYVYLVPKLYITYSSGERKYVSGYKNYGFDYESSIDTNKDNIYNLTLTSSNKDGIKTNNISLSIIDFDERILNDFETYYANDIQYKNLTPHNGSVQITYKYSGHQIGTHILANIDYPGDRDIYAFKASPGSKYKITAKNYNGNLDVLSEVDWLTNYKGWKSESGLQNINIELSRGRSFDRSTKFDESSSNDGICEIFYNNEWEVNDYLYIDIGSINNESLGLISLDILIIDDGESPEIKGSYFPLVSEHDLLVDTITCSHEVDWTINGNDSSKFIINKSSNFESNGQFSYDVKFIKSPDYENPIDHNKDNKYEISLLAESIYGNQSTHNIAVNILDFAGKEYSSEFHNYTFINKGNNEYGIKLDSSSEVDSLTGISALDFLDKGININKDVIGVFDQVTGLNTDSGKMFRLYNAAFARFPDADGLKYWINNFSSGVDDERAVSSSFLASAEFKERYGENVSNEQYVKTLYLNVLNRELDQGGYNYWVGNLNNGLEQRHEVLLGFSESAENKALFTDMTGFG